MSIVTDSKRPEDPKNPDECNIFALHKLFLKGEELSNLKKRYKEGGLSYKESKEMLVNEIISFVTPMREKRKYYENNKEEVLKILKEGASFVKKGVTQKMNIIRDKVGLNI
jgi:tryptophanyl-tRNA synthetase